MARTAPVPNIPPIPGMCPSVAVLAGGGDGGGGSGDGAGNGDGNGNGTGDGSGEGAEGAGNGAGACGNGSPGSCTNCHSNVSAGDPVDVVTGEVFTSPKTDLFLRGPFNLEIRRKYSSFSRKHDVGMGWGWSHSLAWTMHIARDHIVVRSGFGQVVKFAKLAVGESDAMRGWGLFRSSEGYVLRPGMEFFHVFVADDNAPESPLLRVVRFRNRGEICLAYERGRLVRALDAAGRTIYFDRNGEGRIASIWVPDAKGNRLYFARYAYDRGGHLTESIDADGHRYGYAYDDDRRLIAYEMPNGVTFHFLYDRQGRCVETWGDRRDGPDPALEPTLPATLADGVTKAKGIHHTKIEFGPDGYSEVVDSVQIRRFFGTPDGTVTKAVNGRGGVTTRTVNERGDILSETDANGATWHYSYDVLGNVTAETDSEGRTVRMAHDNEGRTIEIVDPIGGVITHGRDAYGNVLWSRDQKGGLTQFAYDRRGVLVEEVLPTGAKWRYTLDDHANTVAVTGPNGATHELEYDYWGRCLLEKLPDGRSFQYSYSNGGKLLRVVDAMGRIKSYEYDGLGNLSAEGLPDGSVTRYHHGGVGWLHTVEQPDGTRLRRYFNREAWVVRLLNEKGESYDLEYTPSGAPSRERAFDGREIRYGRDARDRVVWFEDARGRSVIERNKVGQVVKWVGPDGEETSFDYDGRGLRQASVHRGVKIAWDRDPTGNIVKERFSVGGANYEIENLRDAAGQSIGMQSSLGYVVERPRDGLGHVRQVAANGEVVIRFDRDSMGWPVRRELSKGAAVVDELDEAGRIRQRVVLPPGADAVPRDGRPERVGGPLPQAIDKTYQYSLIDEIVSVTTSADGTVEYDYDVRRHLTAKRGRRGEEVFAYDETGNPFERGVDAPHRKYGAGNRLVERGNVEYVYDATGRVIEKRRRLDDGAVESTRYEWDSLDLLRAVDLPDGTRVENAHDANARRVEKRHFRPVPGGKVVPISTTHYVWDLVSLVHEIVRHADGKTEVHTYLHESNAEVMPLAQETGRGNDWVHYVGDVSGNPEELVDGAGNVLGRAVRTAYGAWTFSPTSKATTPFRFLGQIADPETGLHDNRYRTYDPETGRYLTQDPIGLDGGYNLYEYGPNPIAWADPMGWQHQMTVVNPPPSFRPNYHDSRQGRDVRYCSGMQGLDDEDPLRSRARCHTEQRFAADLTAGNRRRDGQRYQLNGQFPPCPNCHRALQNAAAQTGASVTYNWGNGNSITYHGGPDGHPDRAPSPTFNDGHQAQRLAGAYGTDRDTSYPNNYSFDNHGQAQRAYSGIMNQFYR